MKIGVPKEITSGERRVAITPDIVTKLIKLGFEVTIQSGAGIAASHMDSAYQAAGATIVTDVEELWRNAQIVLKVHPPQLYPPPGTSRNELDLLQRGQVLVSFVWPAANPTLLKQLAERHVSAFAMDAVPRTSRAQKLDALSSMANIAGYRAVVVAAQHFGSFFAGQITAAGRVAPAKVLVIGAGVAGLASIAAAKGLGAVVRAFDVRPAVKEEVESLGAEFLQVELKESGEGQGGYAKEMSAEFIAAEKELFRRQAKDADIVITTALIPGKPAPKLWEADMVSLMKPGSVVVDLAAQQGGNCVHTVPGEVVVHQGVTIVGWTDFTSRMAKTASQLYGNNLSNFLVELGGAKNFKIDLEDDVVRGMIVAHQGNVLWPPPPVEVKKAPVEVKPATEPTAPSNDSTASAHGASAATLAKSNRSWVTSVIGLFLGALWLYLRFAASPSSGESAATAAFVQHLTVFVLSCFIGWHVVWTVTPALHTPLMSVTNAISGIILIGGLLHGARSPVDTATILGCLAILLAMINIAGGFVVTQRMLKMFHK